MKASKILKRQIIIEIFALIFLVGATVYSIFAIKKSNENKISSVDGFVSVVDDTKMDDLSIKSDGEGINGNGTTLTVTNNNKETRKYQVIVIPSVHNTKVASYIKMSIDDVYIKDFKELERSNGGYILMEDSLESGYTVNHLIKAWYKKDATEDVRNRKVEFDYKIVVLKD